MTPERVRRILQQVADGGLDTDAAFANADVIVKQEMLYPRSHPAPMETCGTVADMDPLSGKLTLSTLSIVI